ncbi:HAD family hydrolase [Rhodococcoides yunnanense]|uniref:HAD family hydrolase n=1 Tax=Rhodococcoides yunnanense TaxID=278209 RepID=UPI0009344B91|nr:HAD family hydrolase [Rhodococcus yunnanensis]
MTGALVSVDLDRTMIYSSSALGFAVDTTVRCVEMYQGAPLSYMTDVAADSLERLAHAAVVVPTTTRTVEQYERISLPGAPWRYAITSNGGNILIDGKPDLEWRDQFSEVDLAGVRTELAIRADGDWVHKLRTADELFCYLVVEPSMVPPDFIADWSAWCAARGWNVSQQGRKIYTMPDVVCKSRAVAEVLGRCVDDGLLDASALTLAAGDGALDAEMLVAAQLSIRPRHGELEAIGFRHDRLSVTEAVGGRAGEEILAWLHEKVERSVEP